MSNRVDPSSYNWEESASPPFVWRRKALAGECMWICRPKEQHEIFVCGELTLEAYVTTSALRAAVQSAWRHLRYEVPELVVSAHCDVNGQAWMEYHSPRSEQEVKEWVERTSCLEHGTGEEQSDFEDLRKSILQMKSGRDNDQAFLYAYGMYDDSHVSIGRMKFMLNFDHQITDGIGARILAGRYLSLLAVALSSPDAFRDSVDWEQSGKNLSLPWIGAMNEDQVVSGPKYEEAMEMNRKFIFEQMPTNPGLPLLTTSLTPTTQKTHFITLTETQSTLLTRTLKTLLTPQTTITHLGHASLLLALLRSNAPPPPTNTLYSPCWLNGRRYLTSPVSKKQNYIPICLSFAPLYFTDLQEFTLDTKAGKEESRKVLMRACRMVSAEYGKIRERKSILPENVEWMEDVGRNMWRESQIESSSHDQPVQKTADPFFLSDGITEQYINYSYSSALGKKVLEVEGIRFAANAEKNLIVRMSSWRGRTTVSGEWVSCHYDEGMVVSFLEDIVGIMLSILD